ncbi:MAG: hypothetical protein II315_03230 [Rikenellaceae bacterium]|jgi:hypothetical protein|nr:hypothetical protein [Rikenellaceae bacterium]
MHNEQQHKKPERAFVEQVTDYVHLQLTATKLASIEFVSLTMSNGFGILLAVVAAGLALLFVIGAITLWVARAIGSLEWAMMIAASAFAVVGIVLYTLRERLITDNLVRRFARMLFEPERPDQNEKDAQK